jgi:hypothetical protein
MMDFLGILEIDGVLETLAGLMGDRGLIALSKCCKATRFVLLWRRSILWGWEEGIEARNQAGVRMPLLEKLCVRNGIQPLERCLLRGEDHLFPRLRHLDMLEMRAPSPGLLGGLAALTTLRSMVLCRREPTWPDVEWDQDAEPDVTEWVLDESAADAACSLPLKMLALPVLFPDARQHPLPVIRSSTIEYYDASNIAGSVQLHAHLAVTLPCLPALRVLDVSVSDKLRMEHGLDVPAYFDMGILANAVEGGALQHLEELYIDLRCDEEDDHTIRLLKALGHSPRRHALRVLSANQSDLLNDDTQDSLVAALRGGLGGLEVLRAAASGWAGSTAITLELVRVFHPRFREINLQDHYLEQGIRPEIDDLIDSGVLLI